MLISSSNKEKVNNDLKNISEYILFDEIYTKENFENFDFETIECFDGGPYIEKDNQDNFAFYKQTYYIGKRKER
mgnify:CR=1 FL=1